MIKILQSTKIWRAALRLLHHLDFLVAALVTARCAWIFSKPLRSPELLLGLAQDDFYYYLKTAQNLAWHHHATVFRDVHTNGYHPLYFLLLACISLFVKTLPGVYRVLWGLDTLSAIAIFFLTRRIFYRVAGPLLANSLAVLMASLCVLQICLQMEVTLALPLGFAFLLAVFVEPPEMRPSRFAVIGLLGALTFLARLDAGLLVVLWLAGFLCQREYRAALTWGKIASFLGACLPLPLLYFWVNYHFFKVLLPVSGMAKELRHGRAPSFLLFSTFAGTNNALVLGTLLGLVLLVALRKLISAKEKVFLCTALLHPFLFYGIEMFVSDWPVWPWYFYALRFSLCGALVCVCIGASRYAVSGKAPFALRLAHRPALAAVLLTCAVGKLMKANYNVDRWMLEIQHAAGVLNRFAETHPGAYAMGDRAGMFLATTSSPVLQAEGLVMDKAYLEHIRAQEDLRTVLAFYHVDYYVAFVPKWSWHSQFEHGCFHAMEPFLAGPSAMRMRSDFCEAPLYHFAGFDGVYLIYPTRRSPLHSTSDQRQYSSVVRRSDAFVLPGNQYVSGPMQVSGLERASQGWRESGAR